MSESEYSNGNVIKVQIALRHKSVLNTMTYIHRTQQFKSEEFEVTTATTAEEISKLGKEGWTKYDEAEFQGVKMHFYRKSRKFGVYS